MNRLKSLFFPVYLLVAIIIAAAGLYRLIAHGFDLIWFGAVLTTLPALILIGGTTILRNIPRPNPRLPLISSITVLGAGLAMLDFDSSQLTRTALVSALVGLGGYLLFAFWYSRFGRKLNPLLAVGNRLPEFAAQDEKSGPVTSRSLLGRPALIMFYRGNWCPICTVQVKEIVDRYRQLTNHGVQIVMISPQPHYLTRKVARTFNVPIAFWVDPSNRVAKALGIATSHGTPAGVTLLGYESDTVRPTVIITDSAGRIIFTDQTDSYRVRPCPETFIEALKAHGLYA